MNRSGPAAPGQAAPIRSIILTRKCTSTVPTGWSHGVSGLGDEHRGHFQQRGTHRGCHGGTYGGNDSQARIEPHQPIPEGSLVVDEHCGHFQQRIPEGSLTYGSHGGTNGGNDSQALKESKVDGFSFTRVVILSGSK
eukprot:scaffold31167_cov70-Attheya_sp.AAC.2